MGKYVLGIWGQKVGLGLGSQRVNVKNVPNETADSNILASLEAGWGNCLPYVLVPLSLSCKSGG